MKGRGGLSSMKRESVKKKTMWEKLLIGSTNGNTATCVKRVRCQLDFNNRCSAHMYIEIHVRRDCYAYSCSWVGVRAHRGTKKEIKTGRDTWREREGASERELGCGWELRAVGSRSVQLSQAWLILEAVKIHLLPAHYNFILQPEAHELRIVITKHSVKLPGPREQRFLSCINRRQRGGTTNQLQCKEDGNTFTYKHPAPSDTHNIWLTWPVVCSPALFSAHLRMHQLYWLEWDNHSQALLTYLALSYG